MGTDGLIRWGAAANIIGGVLVAATKTRNRLLSLRTGMTGDDGGQPGTVTSDAQTTPSIIFVFGAPTVQAVILGRNALKYSAFPCAAPAAISLKASSM